jgi:hypothetical protein
MRSGVVYEIQVNRSTKDKGNAIDRGLFMCGCGRSGNWPGSGMGGASRLPWCRVISLDPYFFISTWKQLKQLPSIDSHAVPGLLPILVFGLIGAISAST